MDEQPVAPTDNTPATPVTNPTPAVSPPAPAAVAPLPGAPDSWPGAFGVYKYSKQAVKPNVVALVGIYVLVAIIAGALGLALGRIGQLISYVVDSLASVSFVVIWLAGVRGTRIEFGQALSEALPFWLKMIGLNILVGISIVVSAVLLIIPLFFVLPRLTLASYFLIDKKMGIVEAYKASWAATKGHATKVWGIIGVSILIVLLMITIIGIPFSIYFLVMYSAATAVLYEFITTKAAVTASALATPAAAPAASSAPAADTTPPPANPSPENSDTISPESPDDTPPKPSTPLVQ